MPAPRTLRQLAACILGAAGLLAAPAAAQTPMRPLSDPVPPGQRIEARDGDVIVLTDDARVQVVQRRKGTARMVYDATRGWVIVLLDAHTRESPPDGTVDWSYRFSGVSGTWPLSDRWEGPIAIDQYRSAGTAGVANGTVIDTPAGMISFLSGPGDPATAAGAMAMSHRGSGMSMRSGTFDAVERQQLAEIARDDRDPTGTTISQSTLPNGARVTAGTRLSATPTGQAAPGQPSDPDGALRLGGSVATPRKIVDVPPLYPEKARAAGITGVVIVEAGVDATGAVTSARILRGQPLLDEAALAAVRQWRYEPTLLAGAPVPIVMTVTVTFPPPQ